VFFLLVQTTAIAGSVIFGFVTDRIGPKRTIVLTLGIWIVVVVGAIVLEGKDAFFQSECWPECPWVPRRRLPAP